MYSARFQECKSPRISLNKQRKCETSRASEPEPNFPHATSTFTFQPGTLHWEQLFLFSWQLRQPATIWGLTATSFKIHLLWGSCRHFIIGENGGKTLWMEGSRNVLKEICLQESCIEKPYFIGNDVWKFLSFEIRECHYAPKQKLRHVSASTTIWKEIFHHHGHSFKTHEKKSTSSHSTSSAVRILMIGLWNLMV